ncbi:glycosyl hydrolase family 88 [Neptunitalea chrysea]|uniref:Glycosyl hydrolase family 88 n=1 Tax=Neptunitalea chrysea TaxID=1647581 RepID=A0A9W6ETL9_9FLAO|nr:glycoside hydrolase family 88 protein [Neptunitalea chrysea]GLB51244.1 glycosyl hydrolase family 88 [Neptunitalea chrysea]
MKSRIIIYVGFLALGSLQCSFAQKVNDATTPLHLLQPDYPVPYEAPKVNDIEKVLTNIYTYLEATTPMVLIDKTTRKELKNNTKVDAATIMKPGDFRLTSYEWGVTYAGMLLSTTATNNPVYLKYTTKRLDFLVASLEAFEKFEAKNRDTNYSLYHSVHPHALDDCGAICAAMIKTAKETGTKKYDHFIHVYIDYISNKQFRLPDGTLARNRPQPNSLWLDDLFMSIPALAQMGSYTGETKYYNDAIKQILQFSERMFNTEKGLYMHGWIQGMEEHPQFHWARANGWAVMAMVELLEVLPENHSGREEVLQLLKQHIRGLANYQDGTGFWHQLIDRNDTYLETSATAIYTYAITKAINKGYVDPKVYGPVVSLAWNAITTKVLKNGQIEGTCVGTGMGFDPAFYYYRPVNVYAAHGYGPVLLAGAEMIRLVNNHKVAINDSSLQFYDE